MRYDTPVFFQHITPGEYDASTGDYGEDRKIEEMRRASVTDTGSDTLKLIYGTLKQGSKTIRLHRPYIAPFDSIRLGDKTYRVDFSRNQRAFVVSEVQ